MQCFIICESVISSLFSTLLSFLILGVFKVTTEYFIEGGGIGQLIESSSLAAVVLSWSIEGTVTRPPGFFLIWFLNCDPMVGGLNKVSTDLNKSGTDASPCSPLFR